MALDPKTEPPLVESLAEVHENVKRFQSALHEGDTLWKQVASFYHWYYIPELDEFGPSKFIGYREMSEERYLQDEFKHGGRTEQALKRWFRQLTPEMVRSTGLRLKLERMHSALGKRPNQRAVIHVPLGFSDR